DGGSGGDSITTDAGNDAIMAGDGSDTVVAGAGTNNVSGGAGDDSLTSGIGADTVTGGDGADTIVSSGAGADSLFGNTGGDSIVAGAGNDTITGGAGADTVTGNAGADRFVFAAGDASSLTEGAIDRITDFTTTVDKLSVGVGGSVETLVAASTFGSALTAATGVIGAGTSNLVVVSVGTTATYLFADTNDDNVIDTAISFNGVVDIAGGDFLI
ncbi:MAG: calcium-binding protein, partial [Phenylobacterium sp.]|nr:calcium-binding protein [Phenylobacterium sp.]